MSATRRLKGDASRLQDDARRFGSDAQSAQGHAKDALPEYAERARDMFDQGVDRLRGQLRAQGKDAAEAAGDGLETARLYVVDRVQERPLTVTLAALGVGVVLGLMFAGSSRR